MKIKSGDVYSYFYNGKLGWSERIFSSYSILLQRGVLENFSVIKIEAAKSNLLKELLTNN